METPREDEVTVGQDQAQDQDIKEISGDNPPEVAAATELDSGPDDELTIGQERVLELISYVMVNLVDNPEDVTIDLCRKQGRDVYQVKVHADDLGKVIGKGGQTARALRVLLTAVSARTDQRIGLEIVE